MSSIVTNESAQMRHPGWDTTLASHNDTCVDEPGYRIFFSENTLNYIKGELAKLLKNIAPRPIVVAENVIRNVMETVHTNNRPMAIGDIFSRYHMTGLDCQRKFDVNKMVHEVIEIIYDYIKTEYQIGECNKKMSIWNSVYGTHNEHGLLAHPPIKIRNNHGAKMQFNMRY